MKSIPKPIHIAIAIHVAITVRLFQRDAVTVAILVLSKRGAANERTCSQPGN